MKGRAEYLAYRVAAASAGLLPEPVARRLGRALGNVAFARAAERKRMAIRHMTRALGSEHDVEEAARELFRAYGRYWAEVLWTRPRRVAGILHRIEVEGLEMVEGAQAAGTGMIFALPHVGNWEVAGAVAHDLGLELIAVAEALPNPQVARWFTQVRRALGIDVVFADGRPGLLEGLGAALRRRAAVALVTDRKIGQGGVEVRFFGETTDLPAGAAALAMRTNVPVFPVAAFFADGPGHRLVIEPPVPMPDEGSPAERIVEGTQRVARALERLILRHPTQWHMLQPNWPSDHL